MKMLQLTTHMEIGGIPSYVMSLSKALKVKGHDCVVASSGGALVPELKEYGIRHCQIDIRTKSELSPKVIKSMFQVRKMVKELHVEIIHSHTRVSQVAAFFVSRMTGIPYVTTCHGYFRKRMRKIFDTWGSKVIAISAPVKAHLEKDMGVGSDRIELVHTGIDVNRFANDRSEDEIKAIKTSLGIGDAAVVGTIGRLSDVKGQHVLLEAVSALAKRGRVINCIIVGNGPEEAPLKKMARSLGVERKVHFFGSDPDTHKFLSVMDVFVLPSLMEGLGLSLLEAMASARPCIASGVGGILDAIEDGKTGVLFEAGNAKALGEMIQHLLDNRGLRMELGRAAREAVVKRFSLEVMTGGIERVYQEVLDRYAKVQ